MCFCVSRLLQQLPFTETSTNTRFVYQTNYGKYYLYKLSQAPYSTQAQISTANRLIEQYLQESFETPARPYSNVIQWCGTTMLAFFPNNASLSLSNISALLLARSEAYDNSNYICFLSTLKQHRQNGLGTMLLNALIKKAIEDKNSKVTLHVNTENISALSLYLKCGMRCTDFIRGYYFGDRTYASQDAFAMALQLANVKNSSAVCQSEAAVQISPQEETFYKQRCSQASNGLSSKFNDDIYF